MGQGKVFFSKALEAVIIGGKEMVITFDSAKERNSLRVMLYRERDEYQRTVDADIKDKLSITMCEVKGKPSLRLHQNVRRGTSAQCFVDDGDKLTEFVDSRATQDIQRLIEVMRKDGVPEDEIDKTVEAARAGK